MSPRNRLRPRTRASLRVEALEDRAVPALIGLEAADIPVSVTAGADFGGDVAMKADGTGFVVAYVSDDASGNNGIFFKRYDANWQLVQGPVAVNTFTTNGQFDPSVGIDSSGNFVIAYSSFGQDPGDSAVQAGVYARRYNAAGTAIDGAEFRVNTVTTSQQRDPDVAVNAAGQFVVAFRDSSGGLGTGDILAQSYTSVTGTLTPVGVNALVNDPAFLGSQTLPAVAIDGAGNYAVTWQSMGQDGSGFGIYGRRMLQSGVTNGAEFAVNTVTVNSQESPDIAMDGSGNFTIVWSSQVSVAPIDTDVFLQRYNSGGTAQGSNTRVNTTTLNDQIFPHISMNASGQTVVTWEGEEADGDDLGADAFFKTYSGAGATVVVGETKVNQSTSNDITDGNALPGINTAGDFVVLFDSNGTTSDTYLRRYAEDADVGFAAASSNGSEATAGSVNVSRAGAPYVLANTAVTVQVTRTSGGATPGTDFTTTFPTPVNFPADGSVGQVVNLNVVNDANFEGNETIVLGIGTVTGGTAAGTTSHTYTIVDDDPAPTVTVTGATVSETNGTTTLAFTISLSAASGVAVTGNYATADGTATAGSDYTAIGSTGFTIAPGAMSTTVNVTVTGDTLFENNETLTLNLSGVTNTSNATAFGTGTISNDDTAPSLSIGNPNLTEGDSGSTNMTFTVTLTGATALTTMVNYATANGSAAAGTDYTATSGTLTFAPGDTSETFTVPVIGNTIFQANRQFTATLSGQTNSSIGTATGTATIVDDDAAATITISSGNNQSAITNANFASPLVALVRNANNNPVQGVSVVFTAPAAGASSVFSTSTNTITVSTNASGLASTGTFAANGTAGGPYSVGATASGGTNPTVNFSLTNLPPTNFSIDDVTVTEGNAGTQILTFTVTASPANPLSTATVNWATADNTATAADGDYVAASGTLSFAPGVTTQTLSVTVNGDTKFEGDETFFVNLSGATNAGIADGQGVGTITNDDTAPTISINDVTVVEGDAGTVSATFTVSLSAASGLTATVNFATADGTALAGSDYTANSGTVTFAPGVTTQTVTVLVTGDTLDELSETFVVNLTAPTNATIADNQGVGTITDNDPAPTITINDVTVVEGDAGTVTATFTVSLSAASGQTVTVSAATADGTAVAPADYVSVGATTLTFAPGVTTQTFSVAVNGDVLDEASETFTVNLLAPTNATITDPQGVGTITDNDPAPALSINDVTVTEGNAGTVAATFTVSLSAASGQTVTVNFATADGTALAGSDYVANSGTLTFAPGVTTRTVTVLVNGDTVFEPDQTFTVNLSAPTNATVADGQGVGTITNDDAAPTLAINDVTVSEAAGTLTFTVTRTGATEVPISVGYATADGTAVSTAGAPGTPDFTAASGSLTFAPSLAAAATQTFTVAITDDNVYEALEQFTATLSGPTNATVADGTGLATITNDDAAPTLSVGDIAVSENGTATFTVTLTGPTALPIAVDYATADGTAVSAASATPGTPDYTTTAGTLTFAPSAAPTQTLTFTVPLTDDTTNETDETFVLNLSNPSNAATISDAQAVGSIINDDPPPMVTVNDVTLAEGNTGTTAFTFTVSLSAPSAQTVTVDFATADGTALVGSDYVPNAGTLTFAPGQTTQTATVLATGDTVFEPDQTFTLNLSNPTNATIADGQGVGTITNDDTAPTLAINDVTVSEAAGTLTFTVTRTGATEVPIGVDYATADGTAVSTAGGPGTPDFTATTGSLTFTPSLAATATQTFTVAITDDNVYEAVEQFFANLSNATDATIADGVGLATITNDDAAPTLSVGDIAVSENGTATFTVTLTGATALPIAVDYGTINGTAVATGSATPGTPDYTTTGGTLTFTPSASATQTLTVTVPLTDDTTNEATELFGLDLANPTNGATITTGTGTATVTDDDPPPVMVVTGVTAAEGDGGTTAFSFTVILSAASAQTITVNYATADGTALAGSDYAATSGTLTFAPGVTSQSVTVLVNGDTVFEPDQTFTVDLSAPTNATIAVGQAAGTITNDDAPPTLSISGVVVAEGAGTLTFTVTRTGATEVPITVNYATANGTALAGSDYTATSGTATFAPSLAPIATQTFSVAVAGDTADELTETFTATLSGATGATIATATGTGTITDDDLPVAVADTATVLEDGSVTAPSVLGNDNAAPGSVAELVGATTPNGTLTLSTDGTFTYTPAANFNGTDTFQYRARNPAGEVSAPATVTITVTAVNDVPGFTAGPSQTVGRNNGAETVPGWATGISAGPANEAGQSLSFLVTVTGTTNTLAFDAAPAVDPTTGALTFKPTATTFGTATVSVRLADNGGTANGGVDTSAAQTFTITVTRKSTGDDTPVDQTDFPQFAASAGPGGPGTATVYNPNGSVASSTVPFGAGVGVRAVLADFTGDGAADVIAGTAPGVPGRVVVTDAATGKTIFSDFPFGAAFTGGLFVAAGDVNADGRADVIVTPDASGGGRVVIYDGATGQVVASFLGIDDQKFRGGARVAVGDVNGDGVTDVIVSAGLLGGPRVAVFDGTSLAAGVTPRKLINDFFAFDEALRDGVYVAAGDLNGDGFADLIFGGGPGGGARVLARDGKSLFGPGAKGEFVTVTNFLASDPALRAGVQVAVKDVDGDGRADLVTAVQTPTGPDVRLYLGKDLGPNGGPFATDLDPYPGLLTGIYVG